MTTILELTKILASDDPKGFILDNCDIEEINSDSALNVLEKIVSVLPEIKRFENPEFLENWDFQIELTDDEGIQFLLIDNDLELIGFLLEDDEDYNEEEVIDNFGLDSIYIENFGKFLKNEHLKYRLQTEVRYWENDSDFHPHSLSHLQAVILQGYDLPPFASGEDTKVEFTMDEDEIFIGTVETENNNPDYHLTHDHFDPDSVKESLELGTQAWSSFDEEDDDWNDNDLDEWEDDEYEDEWDIDNDVEEEWSPDYEDDELDLS